MQEVWSEGSSALCIALLISKLKTKLKSQLRWHFLFEAFPVFFEMKLW
jgi:hypothetical protein